MSNGLDDLASSRIGNIRSTQSIEVTLLTPDRIKNNPSYSISYREIASPCFNSIKEDYSRTKALYTGSKRLDGFLIILWDLKAFIKWVKSESERVAFEVKVTRQIRYHEDQWTRAKQAFEAELDRINQQRQP